MYYDIGQEVYVLYRGNFFKGTVIGEPHIVLNMRYYPVQFIYKEEGKAPENVTYTFGSSEIYLNKPVG